MKWTHFLILASMMFPGSSHGSFSGQGTDAETHPMNEPVSSDLIVYSQPYIYEYMQCAPNIQGSQDRWLCDDFTLDDQYAISEIYVWILWSDEQASYMNLTLSEDDLLDDDPNTNTDVWSESVPCSSTFTGDSNWGYDIYETHCVIDIDAYPELDPDKHYFLEVQAVLSDPSYILLSPNIVGGNCWYDSGTGIWENSIIWAGMDTDLFFVLYGEPMALESQTWGSIKTLF